MLTDAELDELQKLLDSDAPMYHSDTNRYREYMQLLGERSRMLLPKIISRAREANRMEAENGKLRDALVDMKRNAERAMNIVFESVTPIKSPLDSGKITVCPELQQTIDEIRALEPHKEGS